MPTVQVKGAAVVFDFESPEATHTTVPIVEDPVRLRTLHGLEHDEIFSDYMCDGGDETLADAGVTGGTLRFEFDETTGVLFGFTRYSAPRLLSEEELCLLKEYTVGQWSDGIGENFTQERMEVGLAPQLLFMSSEEVSITQY